jgi:hypothetical protein
MLVSYTQREEEEAELKYEAEKLALRKEFPNATFEIAMDYDELDMIIHPPQNTIVVYYIRDCYCFQPKKKKLRYNIHSKILLTYRDVINQLIDQNVIFTCNHRFFEGLNNIQGNSYEIILGS